MCCFTINQNTIAEETSILEFRFVYDEPGDNRITYLSDEVYRKFYIDNNALLDVDDISLAKMIEYKEADNEVTPTVYQIQLDFTEEGKKKLATITKNNIGKKLGILIDGKLVVAPVITQPISKGIILIHTYISKSEAEDIVNRINNS